MNSPLKIPYALYDGRIVHVDDVSRGASCGCRCPKCGNALVAKKGVLVTDHFSHMVSNDCDGGPETLLHLLAKQIIENASYIYSPDPQSRRIMINSVALEASRGTMRPDVIINDGIPDCAFIEIAVTHHSDEEKIGKLKNIGVQSFEICLPLSAINLSISEFKSEIIEKTRWKKWLYNPTELAAVSKVITKNEGMPSKRNGFRQFPLIPSWSKYYKNDFELRMLARKVFKGKTSWAGEKEKNAFYDAIENEIEREREENIKLGKESNRKEYVRKEYLKKSRGD